MQNNTTPAATILKEALEKEYGFRIIDIWKDGRYFIFKVEVPSSCLFWKDEWRSDLPEGKTLERISIDGFGDGAVWCSIDAMVAQHLYKADDGRSFAERVTESFGQRYGDCLELLDIGSDMNDDEVYIHVKARILPGKTFVNKGATPVESIRGDIVEFLLDRDDLEDDWD